MKKVLMIPGPWHPVPPIKGAAVETWIYEVCKRLLRYQPHVISIGNEFYPKREFKDGIFFYRINFGKVYVRLFKKFLNWDIYSYDNRIFRLLKIIRPDIVHIHNYYKCESLILKIRKFIPKTKIILHMHNICSTIGKLFPEVDCLIGVSNFITSHYKKVLKAKMFRTVYNGVDIKKFLKAKLIKNKIVKKFPNQKNIFYIGRISQEKGVEKFIKLAKLMRDYSEIKFFCVGEIAQKGERRKYYEKLLELIKKYNLINIEFWDWIAPSKIHLIYPLADIIVVPSKFEDPFPLVALEALVGCGVIIAAWKGGMKEYLKNEENAIVIEDYDNFEYIAKDKILELLNNSEKRRFLIKNAFQTVKNNFTWERVASDVEKIYDELV